MSKFKKDGGKKAPGINTSSLPDIVFMLLFFFMVATTTKEIDPMVKVRPATGIGTTDLTPFKQRSEVDFVYLGQPLKGDTDKFEKGIAVQYDGILHKDGIRHIVKWKQDKFATKPAEYTAPREETMTCFKADEQVPMGILFEARETLGDASFFTIGYAASEKANNKGYSIRTQ